MNHTETPSRHKLLDAALEHLALERAAACVLRVPDTDPPLFVAVGPAPAIVELLQEDESVVLTDERICEIYRAEFEGMPGAARSAPRNLPPLIYQFARAIAREVGVIAAKAEASPVALTNGGREPDWKGYAVVEHDQSEGGHCD